MSQEHRHDHHYKVMKMQPYDVMRAIGVLEGYLYGAAIKYIMRAYYQGKDDTEDLEKAVSVIKDLLKERDMEVPF